MIFHSTFPAVMDGRKTQTRRLRKDGERVLRDHRGIVRVLSANGRLRYAVGQCYAVQAARTFPARTYIRLLRIVGEHVQDISEADARAEGVSDVAAFAALWDSVHLSAAHRSRWTANPRVWVLSFTLDPATRHLTNPAACGSI